MVILQGMVLVFCFVLGALVNKLVKKYSDKLKLNRLIIDINNQFRQVLENISLGKSKFKNRINNTIFIESNLEEHGNIDIVYMIDNRDIAIFKNSKCIYTSVEVEHETILDITQAIDQEFKDEIIDVVDVLGFKFYRKEFEKKFQIDLSNGLGLGKTEEVSDIEKIRMSNDLKLSIDDILDKISKDGIGSLTFEETIFLDEYSKGYDK